LGNDKKRGLRIKLMVSSLFFPNWGRKEVGAFRGSGRVKETVEEK